ncbi:hypothetical protein HELRODRAFT_178119 [Helobdella robusta]|uniref:Uncharacterized protein n=1 Tax=Helobdella robusta TaxID=6412 RepID=T1FCR9_HELRO|nr:hypothetical protein HELRODRAFT_178119 [Helobdella robusta]ESN97332.1 hypothetical protein HELRODRAFT_178119 [Helobdella robusta]
MCYFLSLLKDLFLIKVFISLAVGDLSEQVGQTTFKKFIPAYSYLVGQLKTTLVCFDIEMSIIEKFKARDRRECIIKCLSVTNGELRGVNYIQSTASCSCVPKANIRYNVTAVDLIASNVGCKGKVCNVLDCFTTDCPANFDYWYSTTSATRCSTHFRAGVLGDADIEKCPVAAIPNSFGFFTSGFQIFKKGVSKFVQMEASVWHSGEPNSNNDGKGYCIQSIFYTFHLISLVGMISIATILSASSVSSI